MTIKQLTPAEPARPARVVLDIGAKELEAIRRFLQLIDICEHLTDEQEAELQVLSSSIDLDLKMLVVSALKGQGLVR